MQRCLWCYCRAGLERTGVERELERVREHDTDTYNKGSSHHLALLQSAKSHHMLPALLHAVVPVPGSSALQHARTSDKQRSQAVSSLHTGYPSRRGGRHFCLFLVLCCWALFVSRGHAHLPTARRLPAGVTSRGLTTASD